MEKEISLDLVKNLLKEKDLEKIRILLDNVWDKYYEALRESKSDKFMKCIIIPSYNEADIKNCIYWALKEGYNYALSKGDKI